MLDRLRRALGTSQPNASTPAEPEPMIVDHHEARRAQQNGARLLDVREPDEWAAGHIAQALFCPLPRLASDPNLDVSLDTPLVTYCKVGARAERAAEILLAVGYTDVRVMRGGYSDWRDAGYPCD